MPTVKEIALKPKKAHLAARLITIIGFDVMVCFFAIPALLEEGKYIGVAFCAFFFLLLSCELLNDLFFKPVSAQMNDDEITFQYLTKSYNVRIDQLVGYSSTVLNTRMFDYNGILFYLKDGRKIELSEFNIKTIQPVGEYLKQQSVVAYFGKERSHMSCFPVKYEYDFKINEHISHKIKHL